MKIGLLFGSFNPIHKGHIAVAKFMAEETDLKQVWLIVSPHNPLKEKKSLADEKKRLAQVKKATGRSKKIKVSDVEFKLAQPSYTISTLEVLKRKYPKNKFVIIMGFDNLFSFHKWKEYKTILKKVELY
ncbi:MAG: nicotinate (nicotinamide) nucleotide adenylyltransferase, partial [Bacteroidia bacterium]